MSSFKADPGSDSIVDMINRRTILIPLASGVLALGAGAGIAQAKHGADDPAPHNHRHHAEHRHGQDDPAGHHRHGNDDGPNHS